MAFLLHVPKKVDGRPGHRKTALLNTTGQKAVLAFEALVEGPPHWPAARVAKVTGIPRTYLTTVKHATAEQRKALAEGTLSLSSLHNQRRKPWSDAKALKVIQEDIGPDRAMSLLDWLTTPLANAA